MWRKQNIVKVKGGGGGKKDSSSSDSEIQFKASPHKNESSDSKKKRKKKDKKRKSPSSTVATAAKAIVNEAKKPKVTLTVFNPAVVPSSPNSTKGSYSDYRCKTDVSEMLLKVEPLIIKFSFYTIYHDEVNKK